MALHVTVWNEGVHEALGSPANIAEYYPRGIHGAIAEGLAQLLPDARIRTATLADPEHGLSEQVVADTDVLLWWGHRAHDDVSDEVVDRVQEHVLGGMGLIVLHSGHFSKIFRRLLGTTCSLKWRNEGERELVWTVAPTHPIAAGVPHPLVIPEQEMYGEYFDIPTPDELVFLSTFEGGEVFRSGVTYTRGLGRLFYFGPGDQEYPVYNQPEVRQVIANAVQWAAPTGIRTLPRVSNPPRDWFLAHDGAGAR
jgi:trehalose utilization protein